MIAKTKETTLLPVQITTRNRKTTLRTYVERKGFYYSCKRTFDIIFSLIFLITIASWLLPLLAIFIKLDSRGPVFFRQRRVGFAGRTFVCFKLRTMIMNSEADEKQATEDDSRITGIGWFLRKTNLDEIPQFWNVLKGDMSIVGPRPHMHSDCRLFSNVVSGYKFRNMVRPGITGLAQVKGLQGPAPDHESIFKRYLWDIYYIRNAGLLLDIKVIARTIVQPFVSLFVFYVLPLFKKEEKQINPLTKL